MKVNVLEALPSSLSGSCRLTALQPTLSECRLQYSYRFARDVFHDIDPQQAAPCGISASNAHFRDVKHDLCYEHENEGSQALCGQKGTGRLRQLSCAAGGWH